MNSEIMTTNSIFSFLYGLLVSRCVVVSGQTPHTLVLDLATPTLSALMSLNKRLVLTNESTVSFQNESDGRKVELDVRGTWYDRSASVTFGGQPVAHISRSIFNMREIFADKDTYCKFFPFWRCFGEGGC